MVDIAARLRAAALGPARRNFEPPYVLFCNVVQCGTGEWDVAHRFLDQCPGHWYPFDNEADMRTFMLFVAEAIAQ